MHAGHKFKLICINHFHVRVYYTATQPLVTKDNICNNSTHYSNYTLFNVSKVMCLNSANKISIHAPQQSPAGPGLAHH